MGSFSGGSSDLTINSTEPISPNAGDLWSDIDSNTLYQRNNSNDDWNRLDNVDSKNISTVTTWNPKLQTGILSVTVDPVNLTSGNFLVKVDGITKETFTSSSNQNTKMYNPISSLSLVSQNGGWQLNTGSYTSKSFSVSSQAPGSRSFDLSSDGTKMFVVGITNDTIYQYSLSTAWDISTASYDSVSLAISGQSSIPSDIKFNDDGTKFYIVGNGNNTVYQYNMTTAYDLSTGSYTSKSFSVSSQGTDPLGIDFSTDGTKFYVIDDGNNTIFQYSLSTAWDISTASYDSKSFDPSAQESILPTFIISNDGTQMIVAGYDTDTAYQYSLSTAWDISTASYDSKSLVLSGQDSTPFTIRINPDGDKLYMIGLGNRTVYQYSMTSSSFSGNVLTLVSK